MAALAFLQLRRTQPLLERPFKAPAGKVLGIGGIVATLAMLFLYFPPSYGALKWPHEWVIVGAWSAGADVLFAVSQSLKTLRYKACRS